MTVPFDQLRANRGKVVEITEEDYDYMLGVLPPITNNFNFFAMSEPITHEGEGNFPTFYHAGIRDGKFYGVYGLFTEACEAFRELESNIREEKWLQKNLHDPKVNYIGKGHTPAVFHKDRAEGIWAQRSQFESNLDYSDMTMAERAYVTKVWNDMGGNTSWSDAFHKIRQGRLEDICPRCGNKAHTNKYVGSEDVYYFCGQDFYTFGGEETLAKKKLIADAAAISDGHSEQAEVEGAWQRETIGLYRSK